MTQRRKSKKTEAEPRRVNRRTFLAGAGAAACVGAGLWLRRIASVPGACKCWKTARALG